MTDTKTEYTHNHTLDNREIERYGRQLITPDIGVQGQMLLKAAKVLVVGAGGLGCPVALYLAAAGVGLLGIVDYDTVEISNLHRQIGHRESGTGVPKCESLANQIKELNSLVETKTFNTVFTSDTAIDIIQQFDIVVDASDNVATRYLVSDACVLTGKPLVSGSALKWEGQVTVYNYNNGPCYRCLFPVPPPAETVTRCSDGGVLGPIVGVIGSLQALETIKIINNNPQNGVLSGRLMIYDGLSAVFRTVRIRSKQASCQVCGDNPTITKLIDYTQFCRSNYSESAGKVEDRIEQEKILTVEQYSTILKSSTKHILLDVRPKNQFEICSLPNSHNIPIEDIDKPESIEKINGWVKDDQLPVYLLCRRGNKSQDAVESICKKIDSTFHNQLKHIKDGLLGWAESIDTSFPIY